MLPESVRDAVLARAARLTPAARLAVDACAISPGRTELRLLDSIVGDETSDVDECIRSGMLVSAGAGVVFRHELGRAAVLAADELHARAVQERRRVFEGFTQSDLQTLTDALDRLDASVRPSPTNEDIS